MAEDPPHRIALRKKRSRPRRRIEQPSPTPPQDERVDGLPCIKGISSTKKKPGRNKRRQAKKKRLQKEEVESVDGLPKKLESDMSSGTASPTSPLPQDKRSFTKRNTGRNKRRQAKKKSTRIELPSPTQPPRNERPKQAMDVRRKQAKLPEVVEKLLRDLYLLLPKDPYLTDALYSRRYRVQVWNIVEKMMSPDYVVESSDFTSWNDGFISTMRKEISCLASWQKRLIEHEKLYGVDAWYDSISFPVAPSSISKWTAWYDDRLGVPLPPLKCELKSRLKEVQSFGMRQSNRPPVKNLLDLVSLFSLGSGTTLVERTETGVEQRIELNSDTFKSKHVFVFCINVPVLFEPDFQCLLNLCKELYTKRADDCKMVMVARMNILADTERAFNCLFSLFPPSCLAVPYGDWNRRELIWKQLDCHVYEFQCFVYDTDGSLLTKCSVNCGEVPYGGELPYGAEAFPFTEEMKQEVVKNRNLLREEGSLENLLRPYGSLSPVEVYEFNPHQQQQLRPISEVIRNNKHVGLYVCCSGKLIPRLKKLYEQCKENKEEFEIVVLYLPVPSFLDPEIFKEKIESEMQKESVSGWWCLPFNNSVSMRFWGLTQDYDCWAGNFSYDWREDKLIIVGARILDMYGSTVLERHGHVYPFTREAVVKRKVEELKKERPLELLSGSELFRGKNWNDTIGADELLNRKKKIIVLMGKPGKDGWYEFEKLATAYEDMKKKCGEEFELVFIEICPRQVAFFECEPQVECIYPQENGISWKDEDACDPQEEAVSSEDEDACDPPEEAVQAVQAEKELFSDMPWYVCRHDDRTRWPPLAIFLRKLFNVPSLVGFGDNGCIRSLKIFKTEADEFRGFCLDDTLEADIHHFLTFTEFKKI